MAGRSAAPADAESYIALVDQMAIAAADDPETYAEVMHRLSEIRSWFWAYPEWAVVETAEMVRLVKTPARAHEAYAPIEVRDPSGRDRTLHTPLDYELLCWTLWFAEEAEDGQFLLSRLTERVETAVQDAGGTPLNWDDREHRLALGRALALLKAIGALVQRDGDERSWLESRTGGETLFEFTAIGREIQPFIPHAGDEETPMPENLEPTDLEHALSATVPPETRLYRHLLLSTVFYAVEDPEAFAALRDPELRPKIESSFAEAFDWEIEVTPRYAALIRGPESSRSPRNTFPSGRTANDIALLLCAVVQDEISSSDLDRHDRVRLSKSRLLRLLSDLLREYGANWGGKGAMGPMALLQEIAPVMRRAGLLAGPDADDYYFVLPLAARYRGIYPPLNLEVDNDGASAEDGVDGDAANAG